MELLKERYAVKQNLANFAQYIISHLYKKNVYNH